jgi:RNA polymerase sigma-70 factor (ECF subfamily)
VESDDRELTDAFLAGDAGAFDRLYDRHAAMLFAFATRLAGEDEADDVAQEAWLTAARSLRSFRGASTLRTWLCGIVVNCARRRWRNAARGERQEPSIEPRPWYDATAAQVDLERAIARLSPRYREVLLLHDVHQFTHEEIGQILSIDTGTSKSNTARARAAVRAMLEET